MLNENESNKTPIFLLNNDKTCLLDTIGIYIVLVQPSSSSSTLSSYKPCHLVWQVLKRTTSICPAAP